MESPPAVRWPPDPGRERPSIPRPVTLGALAARRAEAPGSVRPGSPGKNLPAYQMGVVQTVDQIQAQAGFGLVSGVARPGGTVHIAGSVFAERRPSNCPGDWRYTVPPPARREVGPTHRQPAGTVGSCRPKASRWGRRQASCRWCRTVPGGRSLRLASVALGFTIGVRPVAAPASFVGGKTGWPTWRSKLKVICYVVLSTGAVEWLPAAPRAPAKPGGTRRGART